MKYKIDKYCFDKNFELFKNFIESKDNNKFIGFDASGYFYSEEGYKENLYIESRKILQYWKWNENSVGSGKIIEKIIRAVNVNNNNLVDWRIRDPKKLENFFKDVQIVNKFEQYFFDFYHNRISNEDFINKISDEFGKQYSFIVFWFFIKNKSQYLPISANGFDRTFERMGVKNFTVTGKCSWENYKQFLDLIKQTQVLLIEKGYSNTTLLQTHSFLWLLDEKSKEIQNISKSKKYYDDLEKYTTLKPKQKEQIILARTGQGIFREKIIHKWNRCSVTGCKRIEFLIASHIKPFSECSDKEAVDEQNGLLLIPNLDKLFDKYLISFDDDGKVMISNKLDEETKKIFGITNQLRLLQKLSKEQRQYLKYHRKNIR
jgi:hypothetical protein